ncbi:MAG TPA: hypothetical protein VLT33_35595 [Labilithrix sp.]|nr:hypothetical protein [Labilithrix sp.]
MTVATRWTAVLAVCATALAGGCGDAKPASGARACAPLGEGNVVVEDGATADGLRVVVLQPTTASAGSPGYRLFYGPPGPLSERRLVETQHAGTTLLFRFEADGSSLTASFANEHSGPGSTTRIIDAAGASRPMTRPAADAGAPGAGLTFVCF